MTTGTIKFFNESKGFGFIQLDGEEGGKDAFMRTESLVAGESTPNEGDKVELDVIEGEKGPQAVDGTVKKI